MDILPAEFIKQRRRGERVDRASLEAFVAGFVAGSIPDYQVAAWLMAACFQPLTPEETGWLTQSMADSGRRLEFARSGNLACDKHSTGGVGDKTSLIVAPIVAAAGVRVPMMSGRGLGHTGGTLDKLESISGMNVRLNLDVFQRQVEKLGLSFIGQTEDICPADRKMYALRDVTGTVESMPLICASIMSKKISEGAQAIVFDVKFGSGAFMKSLADAESLATCLQAIARASGLKSAALITNMNQPLGRFVGNALEVQECIEILRRERPARPGKSTEDTERLSLDLAAHMLLLAGRCSRLQEANETAAELLETGKAYRKFAEVIRAQGGDLEKPMPKAPVRRTVKAGTDGHFYFTNVESLGMGTLVLGAGRRTSSDVIDPAAGLEILVTNGQRVAKGDPLFEIYAADNSKITDAETFFKSSYTIDGMMRDQTPLVAKVLQ